MTRLVKTGIASLGLLAAAALAGCAHSTPPPPPEAQTQCGCPYGHGPGPGPGHGHGPGPMSAPAEAAAPSPLPGLVEAMNAAKGQAKVDATAAVVNELAREHMAMHQRMQMMHGHMQDMPCDHHPK